jgi:hypothetical protein
MPTFLVTSKMSPALAARVAASVRGGRAASPASQRRRLVSVARLGLAVALVGIVALVSHARRLSAEHLAASRASLLTALHDQFRSLSVSERGLGASVSAMIVRQATPQYAGDTIADPLKTEAGLREALAASTVYVRGAIAGFGNSASLTQSAFDSVKDAFPLCLLDPPDSHTEQALRAKARAANAGGKGHEAMSHIERLFPLLAVAPLLRSEWERAVSEAESEAELDRLEATFRKAPRDAALRAAKSTQLLLVLDEPGDGAGPTELDGERPHDVRVVLVSLSEERLLLRLRRRVDPSSFSATTRAEYARGVDGCSLALRVRAALAGKPEPDGRVEVAEVLGK